MNGPLIENSFLPPRTPSGKWGVLPTSHLNRKGLQNGGWAVGGFPLSRAGPVMLPADLLYLNSPNPEVGMDWGAKQASLHKPGLITADCPEGKHLPSWLFAQS